MPIHRAQRTDAGSVILDDALQSACHAVATQHLEYDILGADPWRQFACEFDTPNLWHARVKWFASHGQGHFEAPCADSQHAQCPTCGCVTVGTKKGLARLAEVLLMARMAHAVS